MLAALVLLLLLPSWLWAAAWYATPSGSDGNACTAGSPCKSARRLVERSIAAEDTLNLECGKVYRESAAPINPQTPGTASKRITLQRYGSCYEQFGVHDGASNAAALVDAGTNFATLGVQPEDRLHNLTKGAHCVVSSITTTTTTNDTLVCARPVSHTLPVDWDAGDRYLVENKPIVTQARLLNTAANWSCSGGVCQHTLAQHAGRHVWIDGQSTHAMMHDGACNATAMGGATDGQYCTVCNSGTTRNCGASKIYIKSATNPATRWTTPGVEVADTEYASLLWGQGLVRYWTIKDVAFEKVYGALITTSASDFTLDNVRLGWSQRKNCNTSTVNCWEGRDYPWQYGQDERGSELLKVSADTDKTTNNIVLTRLHGHDCENNCLALSGTGNITATLRHSEIYNNDHSLFNTSLSSSTAGTRDVTMEHNTFHGAVTVWHASDENPRTVARFRYNFVYDVPATGDPRHLRAAGRPDPFGIYLQDPGDYTIAHNIVIDGGHGFRLTEGTYTFTNNVIVGNSHTGINANSKAEVRLNNNIIADNGSGAVSSSSFQVGCQTAPCPDLLFENSASNNNKFRQPSGTTFGYMSGQATPAKSLTAWQTVSNGDSNSVTTDDCFVSVAAGDFTLATGCDDIAAQRGPFRELTFNQATMQGSTLVSTWNVGGVQPIARCLPARATVTYNGVGQTEGACAANLPTGNQTQQTIAAAPAAGASVAFSGSEGYVEDSLCIGGTVGACLNAKSRAFGPVTIGSVGPVPQTGWVHGTERTIPSGTNRVLVVMGCWEKGPMSASPLDFTSCTYGGQAMTKVQDANVIDPAAPTEVLGTAWILTDEAGLGAATNEFIVCTPDETPNGTRPLLITSGVYENINQTTPVLPGAVTTTTLAGTSLTTAALSSTGNPGVALQLACSGNEGSFAPAAGWTEQIDVCSLDHCGNRMHVADRNTVGQTTLTGGMTFTSAQTFPTRLILQAFALNGGDDLPPDPGSTTVRTQTASRCAFHNAPGWQGPQDAPCTIVPGHQLAVVGEYTVSEAAEPVPIGKQLSCCWSDCELSENFFPVDTAGSNGVRYASSGLFPHGTVIPERVLTGPACTHVPGAIITQDSMVPQALQVGQCSTFQYLIEVLSSVDPAVTPVLTCAMALDNNTPFALGARTTIQVKNGSASEGGRPPGNETTPPPVVLTTLYVAPTVQGTGDHSDEDNAGLASTVWAKLTPGATVYFLDGTYTGATAMLTPTPGISGTAQAYITFTALNPGSVFLDGENARPPLVINNNKYVIVEGFDVGNSNGHTCHVQNIACTVPGGCAAAPLVILRQLTCFDALAVGDATVVRNTNTEYVLWEDLAAWGTGRRVVEAYESDFTTWRRVFAVWGGGGSATATTQMTMSLSNHSYHSTLENGILRWNRGTEPARDPVAILGFDPLVTGHPYFPTYGLAVHAKVFGTATLVRSGDTYDVLSTTPNRASIWTTDQQDMTDITLQDVVGYIQAGTYDARRPVFLRNHTGATPANKFATRVSNIGTTGSLFGTGWSIGQRRDVTTPSGVDIWDGTDQATLCTRYVNGVLTTIPLWPWPMDARIVAAAARPTSSMPLSDVLDGAASVTAMMETIFGVLPFACGGVLTPPQGPALYVAHNGIGTACTTGAPCSLSTGLSRAQAGEDIVLKNGTYTGGLATVRGGTSDTQRITIRAENRRQAILAGSTTHFLKLYHSYITLRGLVIDGQDTSDATMTQFARGSFSPIVGLIIEDTEWRHGPNPIPTNTASGLQCGSITGGIFRHNLVHQMRGEPLYCGGNTFEGTYGPISWEIYGNTFTVRGELEMKPTSRDAHIHHNIFQNSSDGQLGCIVPTGRGTRIEDNIIRNTDCGNAAVFDAVHNDAGVVIQRNVLQNAGAPRFILMHKDRVEPPYDGAGGASFGPTIITQNTRCGGDGRICDRTSTNWTLCGPAIGATNFSVTNNNGLDWSGGGNINLSGAPQAACDAEVTRILAEMATLPGVP